MNKLFPEYYRPSDKDLSKIWKTCVFVLDTNVLLNLYRYPKSAREDLLKVLKQVSPRLWIPYQAALEFQRNRLDVIAEQVQKFDDVKSLLEKTTSDLRNGLMQLQLKKRHSTINPDEFLTQVDNVVNGFMENLNNLQKEQPDVFRDDELRNRLNVLFDEKVGNPPKSQADLDKIYMEGKSRFEQKFPPGYKDISKGKSSDKESPVFMSGGLTYKREFGDLILWLQIIEEAKTRGWKQVIFITDDDKEDWWWIVDSRGKKTIGPRPELIQEICSKGGVTSFYMYNSERFLEFANTYLKVAVEQESIDQVREISKLSHTDRMGNFYNVGAIAEQAIYEWLKVSFPQNEVVLNRQNFPDFIVIDHLDGCKIGYEVKYFRDNSPISLNHMVRMRIKDVSYKGFYEISKGELASIKIVIVLDDDEAIKEVTRIMKNQNFEIPIGVQYLFGKLTFMDGKSEPRFVLISET
jgi:hypothetical protein